MSDYHFDDKDKDLGLTIRLDSINKQVQEQELIDDELGDKNAYLNMFESEHFDDSEEKMPPDPNKPTAYDALKRKPSHKNTHSSFGSKRFYGLLALLGVILAILGFAFARNIVPSTTESELVAQEDVEIGAYMIGEILSNNQFLVYNTGDSTSLNITVDENTKITDTQNMDIPASSLAVGDLIWLGLSDENVALEISTKGFTAVETTDMLINTSAKTLQVDGTLYPYNTNTYFHYAGKEIQPQELEPTDVVLLHMVSDVVWSVEVLEYHGYLSLMDPESITNGTIQINDGSPIPLTSIDKYVLHEGKHTISISGDTIETTTDTVKITATQTLFYDLTSTQTKMGVVLIQTNVLQPRIYIDGALVDNTETIVLPYGIYDLVVLQNGYEELNTNLVVDNTTVTAEVNLTKIVTDIGVLSLTSNVDGCEVYIQSSYMGETPLEVSLPYGPYHVEIMKSGYETFATKIYINNSMIDLNAQLQED